jgi:protein-S-isoprenylcysteine O-methyltransferase Ste14
MVAPPTHLPLAIFGVVATATISRIVELRLRANVNAVVLHGGSDARALLEKLLGVAIIGAGLFALFYATVPSLAGALGPIPALTIPVIAWIGVMIASLGAIIILVSEVSMGRSWRIGVPEGERNRLVTEGVYRLSRNPIYVGMIATIAGIFLLAPNAITLSLFSVACVSIAIQVRIEEAFLHDIHGAAYVAYCKQTRRWV